MYTIVLWKKVATCMVTCVKWHSSVLLAVRVRRRLDVQKWFYCNGTWHSSVQLAVRVRRRLDVQKWLCCSRLTTFANLTSGVLCTRSMYICMYTQLLYKMYGKGLMSFIQKTVDSSPMSLLSSEFAIESMNGGSRTCPDYLNKICVCNFCFIC